MNDLCVVFDIDDTLYPERDYVWSGFQVVGRWVEKWLGISDFGGACWKEFDSGHHSTIFNRALSVFGQEPSQELISCLVELYRSHDPCIRLSPDAAEAIEQLCRCYPIAVVSDGPLASQTRKVEALGLPAIASPVILTEILGRQFRKPNTYAFARVMEHTPARRYVYVADNPSKDFAGPNELGWTTIRVRRPEGLYRSLENNVESAPAVEMPDCSRLSHVLTRL